MLLSLTAVYGLRAMAVLSGLEQGASINGADLSRATGVPRQYLAKVMRKLVVARLVRGQRGRRGGFQLQRPARAIRIADVLAALSLEIDGGCAFGFAACDPKRPCALHPIWSRLSDSLSRWASQFTLADLGPNAAIAAAGRRG